MNSAAFIKQFLAAQGGQLKEIKPMNAAENFDVLVLGGGTAGKLAAWTMAKEGRRTAVVDRKYIGGSCRFRCENPESASKIPISHSYVVIPNSFSTNFI
jgi:alkyl hydroperoxide reductase subunit AhpF